MSAAVAHRGPDDEGSLSWAGAALGHRRLAIFDLSAAGRQPMTALDGALAIVFNGAIFNFQELRAELERVGRRFRSSTDTEVLLEGYRVWGLERLLQRIRGMFAFAIWNNQTKKLYLARDRLGVKPLFYAVQGGKIAFASSARALRAAGFAGELDPLGMAEFLEFGFVPDSRSVYQAVRKLPAGSAAVWSAGRLRIWRYWSPPPADSTRIGFPDAVEQAEHLLVESVRRRLFADVPIGVLLSGGVDSGLICWAIKRLGRDVTAFSIATPGDPFDESDDARATAKRLGLAHRVLETTAESSPSPDLLIEAFGEPFACASALGMLRLAETVKQSATVLLTGDGGDDVFLGYPEHLHLWRAQRLARRLPAFALPAWQAARGMLPRRWVLRRACHFLDYATGGLGALTAVHEGLPLFRQEGLLGERLRIAEIPQRAIPWSRPSAENLLGDFLEYDRGTRFTGEYLTKVDGSTMYHALEARSPFLDSDLWEFAASLPYDVRLQGGALKAVLRELARRRVGERLARGKKRGFGIPVNRWLVGRWKPRAEEAFRESTLAREGWLNGRALLESLGRAAAKGAAPNRLWYAFILELWLRAEKAAATAPSHPQQARTAHS